MEGGEAVVVVGAVVGASRCSVTPCWEDWACPRPRETWAGDSSRMRAATPWPRTSLAEAEEEDAGEAGAGVTEEGAEEEEGGAEGVGAQEDRLGK